MQLDRALEYESSGQGFESSQARQSSKNYNIFWRSNMVSKWAFYESHIATTIHQLDVQSGKSCYQNAT